MQEDRRKYIRLSAHHLIKYKLVEKNKILSFIRNISAGGVLFFSKDDIRSGAFIEIDINFPNYPKPIKATAKVLRTVKLTDVGGYEVAAEFITVDSDARDFINEKIRSVV